jgi:hypothetical protein
MINAGNRGVGPGLSGTLSNMSFHTGYSTTRLPGYQTQHSLLVGQNGTIVGGGYRSASGITLQGSISNIGDGTPPIVSGGLTIPTEAPQRRRPAFDQSGP